MSITTKNLESALAGESMAHIKYRYFAKIAREEGYEEVAKHFEHTANQELLHAWCHLELLIGKPSTKECLEKAIEGETYEFTTMYPDFQRAAEIEGNTSAAMEAKAQIEESKEHFTVEFINETKDMPTDPFDPLHIIEINNRYN